MSWTVKIRRNSVKRTLIPFSCKFCGISLCSFNRLKRHRDRHMMKYMQIRKSTNRDIYSKKHNTVSFFECQYCQQCFVGRVHLDDHIRSHCNGRKLIYCIYCKDIIRDNLSYEYHVRTKHFMEKQLVNCVFCHSCLKFRTYEGVYCHKSFVSSSACTRHIRSQHKNHKNMTCDYQSTNTYECPVCGSFFAKRSSMEDHAKTAHGHNLALGESVMCEMCQVCFTSQKLLDDHMKTHTFPQVTSSHHSWSRQGKQQNQSCNWCTHKDIIRPTTHECPICGRFFARASSMKNHVSTVHSHNVGKTCFVSGV